MCGLARSSGARKHEWNFVETEVSEEQPTKSIALFLIYLQTGVNASERRVQHHRMITLGWTGNMRRLRGKWKSISYHRSCDSVTLVFLHIIDTVMPSFKFEDDLRWTSDSKSLVRRAVVDMKKAWAEKSLLFPVVQFCEADHAAATLLCAFKYLVRESFATTDGAILGC